VRVSLYLDNVAPFGQPDDLGVIGDRTDDWIAFDLTDADGYYLFDDLPPTTISSRGSTQFCARRLAGWLQQQQGQCGQCLQQYEELDNGVDRLLRADPVLRRMAFSRPAST